MFRKTQISEETRALFDKVQLLSSEFPPFAIDSVENLITIKTDLENLREFAMDKLDNLDAQAESDNKVVLNRTVNHATIAINNYQKEILKRTTKDN